jgi:hypothetical protein
MVAAFQRHEARTGDEGSHEAPLLERHAPVAARMHDERGAGDARGELGHVDLRRNLERRHRLLGRGGDALQLVERRELLRGAFGHELRGEDLAERGVVRAPADLRELAVEQELVDRFLAVAALQASAREPAVEDEVAHALRMAYRVSDGGGGTLRHAEQREAVQLRRVDHRFQVAYPGLERHLGRVAVR